MQEERKVIAKLTIILLSIYGDILVTGLFLRVILAPTMFAVGRKFSIVASVLYILIYLYLILGQVAFIGLSLIYSNVKRNLVDSYMLKPYKSFYRNLIGRIIEYKKSR